MNKLINCIDVSAFGKMCFFFTFKIINDDVSHSPQRIEGKDTDITIRWGKHTVAAQVRGCIGILRKLVLKHRYSKFKYKSLLSGEWHKSG